MILTLRFYFNLVTHLRPSYLPWLSCQPLYISAAVSSTPAAGQDVISILKINVTLAAPLCTDPSAFYDQFTAVTALGWNAYQDSVGKTGIVVPWEVIVTSDKSTCGVSGGKFTVSAYVMVPTGVTLTGTLLIGIPQFFANAYTTGQFASIYGVTPILVNTGGGATELSVKSGAMLKPTTTSSPIPSSSPASGGSSPSSNPGSSPGGSSPSPGSSPNSSPESTRNNNLAMGLGIGLGVGVPVVGAFAAFIYLCYFKPAKPAVLPAGY